LAIYDLAGRLVRRLLDEERLAGAFSARWDGHDDAGRALPSGIYLARLTADGHESVRKLALAR
jgi:flagellar hook assembly protein FlgD